MKGSWSNNYLFKLYPKILLFKYNDLINNESTEIKEILSKSNVLYDKLNNEEKWKYCSVIYYYNENKIKTSINFLNSNFQNNNITFVMISNIFNYKLEESEFLNIKN